MNRLLIILVAIAAFLILPLSSYGKMAEHEIFLPVVENIIVVDGDTFRVGDVTIRLWGIDAIELDQQCYKESTKIACGQASKLALMSILKMGDVSCKIKGTDQYKRVVAMCLVDGLDVGRLLVESGWALDFERYSKGAYQAAENQAKESSRGVWSMKFTRPHAWRKGSRNF